MLGAACAGLRCGAERCRCAPRPGALRSARCERVEPLQLHSLGWHSGCIGFLFLIAFLRKKTTDFFFLSHLW